MNRRHVALGFGVTAASCSNAFAHPGHEFSNNPLLAGWAHPWLGLDHLLAMVAIGLLCVQLGGRAWKVLPTSFLAMMVVGGVIGMSGVSFPRIELGIALSVAALGTAVAIGRRYPVCISAAAIGICGVLHGHAHGTEMPTLASPAMYAVGFLAASASLHALGILGGLAMVSREQWTTSFRLSGLAISSAGILALLGVI